MKNLEEAYLDAIYGNNYLDLFKLYIKNDSIETDLLKTLVPKFMVSLHEINRLVFYSKGYSNKRLNDILYYILDIYLDLECTPEREKNSHFEQYIVIRYILKKLEYIELKKFISQKINTIDNNEHLSSSDQKKYLIYFYNIVSESLELSVESIFELCEVFGDKLPLKFSEQVYSNNDFNVETLNRILRYKSGVNTDSLYDLINSEFYQKDFIVKHEYKYLLKKVLKKYGIDFKVLITILKYIEYKTLNGSSFDDRKELKKFISEVESSIDKYTNEEQIFIRNSIDGIKICKR